MVILLRCLAALALLLLSGCAPKGEAAHHGSSPDAGSEFQRTDDFLRERLRALRIPGAAYAIVDTGGVRHTGLFGTDGDGAAVGQDTRFLWGSVAKPVTATLVMRMAAAGELRLDAPVVAYLPGFHTRDAARSARITVRQLLNQTSGLPTSTRHTDCDDAGRRPADVLPDLTGTSLTGEPGAAHHYSSTNYLLLAAVVEAVTNAPFADVLRARVLDPLGMATAVTSAEQARTEVPRGHRYLFGRPAAFAAPFDPAGVGYGYLGGTVTDLAAFARAGLGGVPQILGDAERDSMFRGDIDTSPGKSYGLGWRRWTVPGSDTPMIWHGGAAPGYMAQVILLPDRAVVLMLNAYGTFQEPRLLDIGFGLAAATLGLDPPSDPADHTYAAILGALGAGAVLLIAFSVRTIVVLRRPSPEDSAWYRLVARAGVPLLLLAALLYLLGVTLPASYGVELPQLLLWAPDIAVLTYLVLVLAAVLMLLRILDTVRLSARHLRPLRGAVVPAQVSPSDPGRSAREHHPS
ncbi:beta-lactamase family protein [Nocardia sp. 2]|uniref:Beta-lactamase family protein n=1 Tax=Nocardia acididurans TaxID=2802282 RepID=A0ABS1MAH3_9NOCA|nr:serine hydrolase domain-containing protein [Nocardia acididurans]MBL1076764.1 beta-lactamase family protein [Nocardia acididurans]